MAIRELIIVIYEPSSRECAEALDLVRRRENCLPKGPNIRLLEWPGAEARDFFQTIEKHVCIINLGRPYHMQGKMLAVLPSGLILLDCQSDVMQLVYEMEYRVLIQPPSAETTARIDRHFARLDELRPGSFTKDLAGAWWKQPEAVHRIACFLDEVSFCVIDDFLHPAVAERVASSILNSRPDGHVPPEGKGGWTRGGTARAAEVVGAGSRDCDDDRLARTLLGHSRGDIIKYAEDDSAVDGIEDFQNAVDSLVLALRNSPKTASRLSHTEFANSAMCSIYPGSAARYIKHADNTLMTDGRRLTAILYLNRDWKPGHGGELRIYEPSMGSTTYKRDVEPLFNRLALFWSTEEAPHEVLSSFRDRAAVSMWFMCAKESVQSEDSFKRILCRARCIGGQCGSERLIAAASTPEQTDILRKLGSSNQAVRDEIMDAVRNDFQGCEKYRSQRVRLNAAFGWDQRKYNVEQRLHDAQVDQQKLFEKIGVPVLPGMKASTSIPSVDLPVSHRSQTNLTAKGSVLQKPKVIPRSCAMEGASRSNEWRGHQPRVRADAVPACRPSCVQYAIPTYFEKVD